MKGEMIKMKIYSKFIAITLLLTLAISASVSLSHAAVEGPKPQAEMINKPASAPGITPSGATGSGWKPDTPVSDIIEANEKHNPSIGSYVNPTTNASTLYVASQWYQPTRAFPDYELMVYRSSDNGNTWYTWWHSWFSSAHGIYNPSTTVVAYNNTVFVATENAPTGGGNHWISVWKFTGTGWWYYEVATDADYRNPQLTSDYGFGSSAYLYVAYEKYTNFDYREVYAATSLDWGKTWVYKQVVFGGFTWCYTQASIFYAQHHLYIAVRDSATYSAKGYISVARSYNWGSTWAFSYDVNWPATADASWPSIAAAHTGSSGPATVIVAYEYNSSTTNHDILFTWSLDYGTTWTGGNDYYHQIAVSTNYEQYPKVTVDGMGLENTNVQGNFHLIYKIGFDLFYTQLPYWDIPLYYGGPYAYQGYFFGWTTPQKITDGGQASVDWPIPTITAYKRTVGGETLWEPGVAWTDLHYFSVPPYVREIYYTTPGTFFRITFMPANQNVVAGKSILYYVKVNLISGPTAPAYLGGSVDWPNPWQYPWTSMSYNVSVINPTATAKLTLSTSNFAPPGSRQFTITATIGGYRRMVFVPYTVIAPPTLTLNVSPSTVARGSKVTISGQLSPAPGSVQTIYLYYRSPHISGAWKLATTISTNVAGAYSVTATVPTSLPPGDYDLVAFWVNTATGAYATSPIVFWTVT